MKFSVTILLCKKYVNNFNIILLDLGWELGLLLVNGANDLVKSNP